MQRVPERVHAGGKPGATSRLVWHLAVTDFTALVVHHCWPKEQILFQAGLDLPEQEEARVAYEFLLYRFAAQGIRAEMAARFKLEDHLPEMPGDWLTHKELPLSEYQLAAAYFCLGHDAAALFMDRGTGKTATGIQVMCMEARRAALKSGLMQRVIVVVPNHVRNNWVREIRRFAVTRGKCVVLLGDKLERIKRLTQACVVESDLEWSAVIIGYDTLAPTIDILEKVPWDFAWADESQKFKNPASARWKAMARLRDASVHRRILTGSPMEKSPMDLWTQFEFLGDGLSGFSTNKTYRKFYGKYITLDQQTGGLEKLVDLRNVPLVQERLSRLAFRITKDEAKLNLPDKVYAEREVQMTPEQTRYYKEICERLALEITEETSGKILDAMTVEHILTKLLRLAQITSGFITWDPVVDPETGLTVRERRVMQINEENPKVEAVVADFMEELLEDPRGKKVVFAIEVESLKLLHRRLEEELGRHGWGCGLFYGATSFKRRDEIEQAFNLDPEFKVLVGNPQCMGEGLDLLGYDKTAPDAADTFIDHEAFYSQNWSGLLRGQSEDRGHRRGTRMPVRISDYVVLGTIDEQIRDRVSTKEKTAAATLEITDLLRSILGGQAV